MSASGRTAPYDVVAPVLWPMTTSGGASFDPSLSFYSGRSSDRYRV